MKISHMKKDELFEGFYLIKSADLRQTRAGKNYLAFTFQDDSGEIEGKLWDAQPPILAMQYNHIAIWASHRHFPIYIFVRSVSLFLKKKFSSVNSYLAPRMVS